VILAGSQAQDQAGRADARAAEHGPAAVEPQVPAHVPSRPRSPGRALTGRKDATGAPAKGLLVVASSLAGKLRLRRVLTRPRSARTLTVRRSVARNGKGHAVRVRNRQSPPPSLTRPALTVPTRCGRAWRAARHAPGRAQPSPSITPCPRTRQDSARLAPTGHGRCSRRPRLAGTRRRPGRWRNARSGASSIPLCCFPCP
jgi:hypothetical protein